MRKNLRKLPPILRHPPCAERNAGSECAHYTAAKRTRRYIAGCRTKQHRHAELGEEPAIHALGDDGAYYCNYDSQRLPQ